MPIIYLETRIAADIEIVFDLSRSIDLHVASTAKSNERAVAGRTNGLIGAGEEVTWEATHFGIRQQLTTRITAFDPPVYFQDSMISGAFQRFDHDHYFEAGSGHTLMKDVFDYTAPLSILGRIADFLFLERYMRQLLQTRNELIKATAESGQAEAFLEMPTAD